MCVASSPSYTPSAAPPPPAAVAPPPVLKMTVDENGQNNGMATANRKGIGGLRIDRKLAPVGGVGGGTGLNIPN